VLVCALTEKDGDC